MNRLSLDDLEGSLNAPLQALYILHGEEDLLRIEALDALRTAARQQGYLNRESHTVEGSGFDWASLLAEAGSSSLFADRKLLEIHIPGGKPGKQGGDVLQALAANLPQDTVTLLVLPKLDKTQIQSKWFATLAKYGTILEAKAVTPAALPAWIRARLNRNGLNIESDALALFAERVEGNLLAAKQEIEKLALLHPGGHLLTMADAEGAVAEVARFDVFQLSAAWMGGDVRRTVHLVEGLQAEGDEPILHVWALAEDIRTLLRLSAAMKQGKNPQSVRNELRLWGDKLTLAPQAARRIGALRLVAALQECARIDRQIKGAESGCAWDSFRQLAAGLAA